MGIPVDWKPERAIQPKEGLKRRLQSELSVLHQALSSANSKDVIRPVILLRKQGVGRKTDDLWVITELGNSGCRVHISIRIDFSFCVQLPLSRNCSPMYLPSQAHFQSIKCIFSQIILFLSYYRFDCKNIQVIFDKESCILRYTGPFQCMFIRLKAWNLIRKVEWPKCWNLDTPGARFI